MNNNGNTTAGRESARLLSERLTGGCHNALARLLDVRQSTVRRWLAGTVETSSIAILLLSIMDVLSSRIGENSARNIIMEAGRRLGRKPDDLRDFRK